MTDTIDQIYQAKSRYRQYATEADNQRRIKMSRAVGTGQQSPLSRNWTRFIQQVSRVRKIRINISIETNDPCPEVIN
jgi:hypothetical protein